MYPETDGNLMRLSCIINGALWTQVLETSTRSKPHSLASVLEAALSALPFSPTINFCFASLMTAALKPLNAVNAGKLPPSLV